MNRRQLLLGAGGIVGAGALFGSGDQTGAFLPSDGDTTDSTNDTTDGSTEEEAMLDPLIDQTNSPVTEGSTLNVDYIVDNLGGSLNNTDDVVLEISDTEEDRDQDVTVSAGGSTTGQLNWGTSGTTPADYTASVRVGNETASQLITVESAIPDGAVDTFESYLYEDESQTLSDYYSGDVANFDRQQTTVIEADYTLSTDQTAGIDLISTSGLPNYPSQGTVIRHYTRASGTGPRTNFSIFASGIGANPGIVDNGYVLRIDWGNQWSIIERNNGNTVDRSNGTFAPKANTDYYVDMLFDGSTVSADFYSKSDDSLQESLSLTATNDYSGTDGVHFGDSDGGQTTYWDSVINQ